MKALIKKRAVSPFTKTQKAIIARAGRVTATSKKYGAGHVLAAGKREVAEAEKLGLVSVVAIPGCGVVFKA